MGFSSKEDNKNVFDYFLESSEKNENRFDHFLRNFQNKFCLLELHLGFTPFFFLTQTIALSLSIVFCSQSGIFPGGRMSIPKNIIGLFQPIKSLGIEICLQLHGALFTWKIDFSVDQFSFWFFLECTPVHMLSSSCMSPCCDL